MTDRRERNVGRTLRGLVLSTTALVAGAITVSLIDVASGVPISLGFLAFACWMIAPGLVVWLHPKLPIAIMWSTLAWFGFAMGATLPWPGEIETMLMVPVLVTLMFVLPIGIAIYTAALKHAENRAAKLAEPPVARVVIRRGA
jgi:hypothetical protein